MTMTTLKDMHSVIIIAFLTIGLTAVSSSDDNHSWRYPDMEAEEEFPKWGDLCDSGKSQSPINLNVQGALKGLYSPLKFNDYDKKQSEVTMFNNGHTIQLSEFTQEMELKGGPLRSDYEVEQIHLHWWSEHTINNIRYPLEAHIVHRNKRYNNMQEASKYTDGIAVIGILYHASNEENEAINDILDNLDDVKNHTMLNKSIHMKNSFVVKELFPEIEGYFSYSGSLTTPGCNEVVTWIVLSKTFPVTMQQIKKFQEIEYDNGKFLKNNYRFVQKPNNRAVIVVEPTESKDGGATGIKASLTFILLTTIATKFLF